MSRARVLLLLVFVVLLTVGGQRSSYAANLEFSLHSIILFALHNNPELSMAEERQTQAYYQTRRAASAFYPDVSLNAQTVHEYNASWSDGAHDSESNNSMETSFSLTQLLFDGFKTAEDVKRRKEQETTAEIQTTLLRQQVISDTIEAYLSVLRFQQTVKDTEVFLDEIQVLQGNIEEMFEAGAVSKAKLDFAKARIAFAKSELNNAKSSYNDAISNLEEFTGKLPNFNAVEPTQLNLSMLDLGVDYYLKLARKENEQVKLNRSDLKAREHELKAQEATFFPTFNFELTGKQTRDDGGRTGKAREVEALLKASYTLFDGYDRTAAANRIESQIKELEYKERVILDDIKKRVKLAYNQFVSIQEDLKTVDEEIAANTDVQKLNRENFRLGSVDVIELIEGEERLVQAKVRRYELISSQYLTTYQLLNQVGILHRKHFCETC